MRRLILSILFIFFCFFSINVNLYGDPDYQLENEIIYLERDLNSPRYSKRLQAIRKLECLPSEADEIILKRYSNSNSQRKKYLLLVVLANRGYEVIPIILKDLPFLLEHKGGLLRILRKTPIKSYKFIYYQLFENPNRPDRQPALEELYIDFMEIEVINAFQHYFTKAKNYRFFEKDFERLLSFGVPALDILVKIAHNDPRLIKELEAYSSSTYLRVLAVRLLTLSNNRNYVEAIKQAKFGPFAIKMQEEILISLYLLDGQEEIIGKIKEKLIFGKLATNMNYKISKWAEVGTLYQRINKRDEALGILTQATDYIKEKGTLEKLKDQRSNLYKIYFSLAEIYMEDQNFPKIVETLNQLLVFSNDSSTWEIIFNNRNFEAFWKSDIFTKWVEEQKQDNTDIIPNKNPGYLFQE